MSRLNRSDISRVLYGSQTVNLIRKGRIQIYPAPDFTEVYLLDDNKMYSVQVTETGDYLLSDDYLVTDTSIYEYLPPYVVVDPDKTGQWILSTQSRHSDMSETTYFMSNSNYHVSNGYARVKVAVQGIQSLALKYGCYAQRSYDYLNIWKLDYDASSATMTNNTSGNSPANTYRQESSSAPNLTYTYTLDGGEHFFWVTYGKNGSTDSNEDRGYIGIATSLLQDRTVNNVDVYYEIAPDDYFLSGGVYREKLVASDGSEPLPGNILQSSLSENAEIMDVEGTMYEAFYYYVTIKGVQVKAREYVLGNVVSAINAHFLTGNTNAIGWDNIRHKWDNGYKISLYWIKTASYSEDMRGFDAGASETNHSPLEICAYNNGWYLDFHSPNSTTSNSVSGGDFDFRTFASNLTSSTNTVYRFDIQISPYWIDHKNADGTNIQSFSSTNYGSVQSSYNFYDGYYLQRLFVMKAVAVGRIVIRDASDNIIHDYIMTDTGASGNSRYVLKDFIEDYSIPCSYTGTVTDVKTQEFTVGSFILPKSDLEYLQDSNFGDLILENTHFKKYYSIPVSEYNLNDYPLVDYHPIAMNIHPASESSDGLGRVLSLKRMSVNTPETGTGSQENIYWGYNQAISGNTSTTDMDGKSLNELILSKATTGLSGTIVNSVAAGNYPAFCAAYRYHTNFTKQGDWYLPTYAEYNYMGSRGTSGRTIYNNFVAVTNVLGAEASNYICPTQENIMCSTEKNNLSFYYMYLSKNGDTQMSYYSKTGYAARAVAIVGRT